MAHPQQPVLGDDGRIVEGIATTRNEDGTINVAPMGPIVNGKFTQWIIRPFRSSTTYQNLVRERAGVFHIVDDVQLIAEAAVGLPSTTPQFLAEHPLVLSNCCRWYEWRIDSIDATNERTQILAYTTGQGCVREFFGFNRAKHAVLEAAILATRLHLLPERDVLEQIERLQPIVEKTGGAEEHQAFNFIQDFIARSEHRQRETTTRQ